MRPAPPRGSDLATRQQFVDELVDEVCGELAPWGVQTAVEVALAMRSADSRDPALTGSTFGNAANWWDRVIVAVDAAFAAFLPVQSLPVAQAAMGGPAPPASLTAAMLPDGTDAVILTAARPLFWFVVLLPEGEVEEIPEAFQPSSEGVSCQPFGAATTLTIALGKDYSGVVVAFVSEKDFLYGPTPPNNIADCIAAAVSTVSILQLYFPPANREPG